MKKGSQKTPRHVAMDLLARREHSVLELSNKLRGRDYDSDEIDEVIHQLQLDGLQSDERFTESYIHHRYNAGYGPMKITHELQQRGIQSSLINRYLEALEADWDEHMQQQRTRKFGADIPDDYALKMKQARFLQNRGFSAEAVMRLFR